MAAALAVIGAIGGIAGTIMQHKASKDQADALRQQGQRREDEANFEASQLDRDAIQAQAVAQRQAEDVHRQANLIGSLALSRAAASNAGASDPTVMQVIARTQGMGAYRAGVSLWEGDMQARLDRLRGEALRRGGAAGMADALAASGAANRAATATLLTGTSNSLSMAAKYWPSSNNNTATNTRNSGFQDAGTPDQIGDTANA